MFRVMQLRASCRIHQTNLSAWKGQEKKQRHGEEEIYPDVTASASIVANQKVLESVERERPNDELIFASS